MTAQEIMDQLCTFGAQGDYSNSCDTLKAGDPERQITKVAVTMTATAEVLRQAFAWGAELMIVHEPTYFNHWDEHTDDPVECKKRSIIQDSGLVIYRFHDHPHIALPDMIAMGMMKQMALDAEVTLEPYNLVRATLHQPMTAVEFAKLLENRLNIRHLRICGARDIPSTKICARFGASGGLVEQMQRNDTEIMLCGETTEWSVAEYARDAAGLGLNKTLIIMGHVGSERYGMVYIAEELKKLLPQLDIRYFETDEVYTYTD